MSALSDSDGSGGSATAVFVSGALWGVNSFDQWGVELGKALCNALLLRLDSGDVTGLDGSTAGLLRRLVE